MWQALTENQHGLSRILDKILTLRGFAALPAFDEFNPEKKFILRYLAGAVNLQKPCFRGFYLFRRIPVAGIRDTAHGQNAHIQGRFEVRLFQG
jgi:hypothetical protein